MKTDALKVSSKESGTTLQDFISKKLALSRNKAKQLIDNRNVFVNQRRTWMARHALKQDDIVEIVPTAETHQKNNKTVILFSDDNYIVVNKPSGILSNGANSIEEAMRSELEIKELACAHRLDRDTSGCLLMAKNIDALKKILPLFRKRLINKTYHAIAKGKVFPKSQTIRHNVDDQPAVSLLETIDSNHEASHVRVKIKTGRTHQIRKHLQHIRHHVLGDRVYGTERKSSEKNMQVSRQMLHAADLSFPHPITGKNIKAHATLPKDFRDCLRLFILK